jgi:hypothetical protein
MNDKKANLGMDANQYGDVAMDHNLSDGDTFYASDPTGIAL